MSKTISIFGSTGSVGENTVSLIADQPARFKVRVLTARSNWQKLAQQAQKLSPEMGVVRYKDQRHSTQI